MTGSDPKPALPGDPPRLAIEEVEARVQQAQMERERRARISAIVYPVLVVLATLILWEAGTRGFAIPAYIFPPPSQVAAVMIEKMPLLLRHGWVSTTEIVLGFLLSWQERAASPAARYQRFVRRVLPAAVVLLALLLLAFTQLMLLWSKK